MSAGLLPAGGGSDVQACVAFAANLDQSVYKIKRKIQEYA